MNRSEVYAVFEREHINVTPKQYCDNLCEFVNHNPKFVGVVDNISFNDFRTAGGHRPPELYQFSIILVTEEWDVTNSQLNDLSDHLRELPGFVTVSHNEDDITRQ